MNELYQKAAEQAAGSLKAATDDLDGVIDISPHGLTIDVDYLRNAIFHAKVGLSKMKLLLNALESV